MARPKNSRNYYLLARGCVAGYYFHFRSRYSELLRQELAQLGVGLTFFRSGCDLDAPRPVGLDFDDLVAETLRHYFHAETQRPRAMPKNVDVHLLRGLDHRFRNEL